MNTPPFSAPALLARIKLVLLQPTQCWSVISGESKSPKEILISIFLPLVALSAMCTFLFSTFIGVGISFAIKQFVLSSLLAPALLFLFSLIAAKLAPSFGGSADQDRAFSWLAHCAIPSLVATIFIFVPALYFLISLAATGWAVYLMYLGAGSMLSIPSDKRIFYLLTLIVSMIIVSFVAGMVVASVAPSVPVVVVPNAP